MVPPKSAAVSSLFITVVKERTPHYSRRLGSLFLFLFTSFEELCTFVGALLSGHITVIIWLAPRAGKMNQIAHCDWLPERARWSHRARSGLPALSRKQNFPESNIINPLLTKFVRSRWLDIGLVLFFASLWTLTSSRSINTQKRTWPISSLIIWRRVFYWELNHS